MELGHIFLVDQLPVYGGQWKTLDEEGTSISHVTLTLTKCYKMTKSSISAKAKIMALCLLIMKNRLRVTFCKQVNRRAENLPVNLPVNAKKLILQSSGGSTSKFSHIGSPGRHASVTNSQFELRLTTETFQGIGPTKD